MGRAEPRWLKRTTVLAIHEGQIAEHGGSSGVRDHGLLDSALARPQQKYAYGADVDLFDFAAAYTFGIAKNHAFVDGNKRTSFVAAGVFLDLNGYEFDVPEPEAVRVITDLAAGRLKEAEIAASFRQRSRRKKK